MDENSLCLHKDACCTNKETVKSGSTLVGGLVKSRREWTKERAGGWTVATKLGQQQRR